MKATTYLSILWMFFGVTSVCQAQKATAVYNSITKMVTIDVANESEGTMILMNNKKMFNICMIDFVLKSSHKEVVYHNTAIFRLKDTLKPKNIYLIPAKSKRSFQLDIASYLKEVEKVNAIKTLTLAICIYYHLEKENEPSSPIRIDRTLDF